MTEKISPNELLSMTTEIVSAHLSNNTVAVADIPQLIKLVYTSLAQQGAEEQKEVQERPVPAVPIKKSVMPDYIICLEDGKKLKMLKRHLKTRYNMTPRSIARSGVCRMIIRWWRLLMPSSARSWRRRSGSVLSPARVGANRRHEKRPPVELARHGPAAAVAPAHSSRSLGSQL